MEETTEFFNQKKSNPRMRQAKVEALCRIKEYYKSPRHHLSKRRLSLHDKQKTILGRLLVDDLQIFNKKQFDSGFCDSSDTVSVASYSCYSDVGGTPKIEQEDPEIDMRLNPEQEIEELPQTGNSPDSNVNDEEPSTHPNLKEDKSYLSSDDSDDQKKSPASDHLG